MPRNLWGEFTETSQESEETENTNEKCIPLAAKRSKLEEVKVPTAEVTKT